MVLARWTGDCICRGQQESTKGPSSAAGRTHLLLLGWDKKDECSDETGEVGRGQVVKSLVRPVERFEPHAEETGKPQKCREVT